MNANDRQPTDASLREVRFEHSSEFIGLLKQAGVSLLVTTYQANKLVVIGQHAGELQLSFHNFERAMGLAVQQDKIAIGGRAEVWYLNSTPDVVAQWGPNASHDACFLTRTAFFTEEIHGHELAWCNDQLWIVNTRFSCLCTLESPYSFVPRWRPSFITKLAAEDRCHLNGLAVVDNRPKYVTAMAESDTAAGWRSSKATTGCLLDVETGETVARGFAMPHSPRVHQAQLWVLDSGRGALTNLEPNSGKATIVSRQPGYTRGLDFCGPFAFIGLSRIRETSTFDGIPIAENRENLKCGVAIVDWRTGQHLAHFEFLSGVEEIFDVRVVATAANPYIAGPKAMEEGGKSIWFAPASPVPTRIGDEPFVAAQPPAL
ncbi:TIGR03032 family protein [Planctomycetaceae bacterium SH139]